MKTLSPKPRALAHQHAHKTVLNVPGTLSAILNTAKQSGCVCQGMSLRRLTLPVRGEKRDERFFSVEEARKIIARAGEPFATAFVVAAMTGVRRGRYSR